MKHFVAYCEGEEAEFDANTWAEAEAEALDWAVEGMEGYSDGLPHTTWVDCKLVEEDDDGEEVDSHRYHNIPVEPKEPECEGVEAGLLQDPDTNRWETDPTDGRHDWESPHEVVGGMAENPGVHGHGGGVIVREVCRWCGMYRVDDSWAQNPENGAQGLNSIAYECADNESLEWVYARLAVAENSD